MYSRKNVPTEEALQSYRPYTGETLPATLDDAVAGTRFSKDRGSAKKRESVRAPSPQGAVKQLIKKGGCLHLSIVIAL